MKVTKTAVALGLAAIATGAAYAQQGNDPKMPHLDHAYVIVMENHAYSQILGNPNAPFITSYAHSANLATNYFAVGHPSLTNYLEIVGGSNFGVINDNSPDWHNTTCVSNLELGTPTDESVSAPTCPIAGSGMDAATPAVDTTNEGTPSEPVYNDPLPSAHAIAKTIADQLDDKGLTWKSYQESLPPYGADRVNNSDGLISDVTEAEPGMPKLYAVKHNPFVYFAKVEEGKDTRVSLDNTVGFDRLFSDLKFSRSPNYSFIVPNQCHDQHGRGTSEVGTGCSVDQNDIAQGDAAVSTLITAIKSSEAWKHGQNAIVLVWDENDYSSLPNQVITVIDTNYGQHGVTSNVKYNHFSLLKSLEAAFGLPYLNHAADKNVKLMTDLFK